MEMLAILATITTIVVLLSLPCKRKRAERRP